MKFYIKGAGTIELRQQDFIDKGGEKSIYAKGMTAYALYHEKDKMIPIAKIDELSVLENPDIIRPQEVLLDNSGTPIGYSMRYLKDTLSIVQLFTKAFKKRNAISEDMIINLVKKLQDMINYIHTKKILVVDLNENNFLTDLNFQNIYGIDTSNYQTPNFPAKVIMESVRDRHCNNKFSQETDWFSWGIIACQLILGIHPYKGKHPKYINLPKDQQMNQRMIDNVSIFNKDSTIPKVCGNINDVPPALRKWFESIFENGVRGLPPQNYEAVAATVAVIKQIAGSDLFEIILMQKFDDEIIRVCSTNKTSAIITTNHLHMGGKFFLPRVDAKISFSPLSDQPIAFWLEGKNIKAFNVLQQQYLNVTTSGDHLMECNGRVYTQNGRYVIELKVQEFENQLMVVPKQVGRVMDFPGATKVFDGVIIQNVVGTYFVSIFPETGTCFQFKIQELQDYRIIESKYENNVLLVIGQKNGQYDRFVFRFDKHHKSYDVRVVNNIAYTGLNFTVADHGVCVLMNEEEKIEAFSNQKDSSSVKILDDKILNSDMRLYHKGSSVLFTKNKELYRLVMK